MAICTQSMYAKIRVESQAISENTRGQDLRSSFYLYNGGKGSMFRGLLCVVIPMLNFDRSVKNKWIWAWCDKSLCTGSPNEHLVDDCFRKLYEPGEADW